MKLTFNGGFHNSREITVNVKAPSQAIWDVLHNAISVAEFIDTYCSKYQRNKLEKHFCGISDCKCGSYHRNVQVEIASRG